VPPTLRSQVVTRYRRTRFWLAQFSWWAIAAFVLALAALVGVVFDWPVRDVLGLGLAGATCAILSLKEQP
jgi:hypothetical protein